MYLSQNQAWEGRNGVGRLVKKEPRRERATYISPASITLHEGNFASDGVILVTIMRTHPVDSDLCFEIVERPAIGMIRVIRDFGDNCELVHLAESREAAELWLAKSQQANARLEKITADEVGADIIEGRAA